jgi:hypothetical protein
MKVCYTHFSQNAVVRERYREGVDFLDHHFDLGFDDTLYLLKELKNERCALSMQTPKTSLYFFIDSEKKLWVDLDDVSSLWAQSEVTLEAATEIIRIVFDGGEFNELIPTTEKEWDAYAWPSKAD